MENYKWFFAISILFFISCNTYTQLYFEPKVTCSNHKLDLLPKLIVTALRFYTLRNGQKMEFDLKKQGSNKKRTQEFYIRESDDGKTIISKSSKQEGKQLSPKLGLKNETYYVSPKEETWFEIKGSHNVSLEVTENSIVFEFIPKGLNE